MIFEIITVQTHSGFKSDEHPQSFDFQERRWQVDEIIDRWHEGSEQAGHPNFSYFKVHTSDGSIFILRHNTRFDSWAILLI